MITNNANIIQLEAVLKQQHELKRYLTGKYRNQVAIRKSKGTAPGLKSTWDIAAELKVSEKLVRVTAWQAGLDPFPEDRRKNNIWMACFHVVHMGYSVSQAAKITGYSTRRIRVYLAKQGWKPITVWRNSLSKNIQRRYIIIPAPLADGHTIRGAKMGLEGIRGGNILKDKSLGLGTGDLKNGGKP